MKYGTIKEERPELVQYMVEPEKANKYHIGTAREIDWICPSCGRIIRNKRVNKVVSRGIPCTYCSDGVSKPEKIVASALRQLGLSFEQQKTFAWFGKKRYDFYIPCKNCIIEVNGSQHYGLGFERLSGVSFENQKSVDELKRELADNNGIENYIVVEAISTTARQIIPKLMELLSNIGVNGEVDISICELDAMKSNVVKAASLWNGGYLTGEISTKLGVAQGTAIEYLKVASDIGLCNYSSKTARQISQKKNIVKKMRRVRCVNTGEVFESLHMACKKYNISSSSNIIRSCNSKNRHAGATDDGTLLKWEYV